MPDLLSLTSPSPSSLLSTTHSVYTTTRCSTRHCSPFLSSFCSFSTSALLLPPRRLESQCSRAILSAACWLRSKNIHSYYTLLTGHIFLSILSKPIRGRHLSSTSAYQIGLLKKRIRPSSSIRRITKHSPQRHSILSLQKDRYLHFPSCLPSHGAITQHTRVFRATTDWRP